MPGEIPPAAFTLEWRFVSDGSRGRFGVSESASGIQEPDYSRLPAGFRKENEGYQLLSDRIRRARMPAHAPHAFGDLYAGRLEPLAVGYLRKALNSRCGGFLPHPCRRICAALLAPKPEEGACRVLAGLDAESLAPASNESERDEAARELHNLMSVMTAAGGCATKLRIWMCSLRRFTFSDAAGTGKRCS